MNDLLFIGTFVGFFALIVVCLHCGGVRPAREPAPNLGGETAPEDRADRGAGPTATDTSIIVDEADATEIEDDFSAPSTPELGAEGTPTPAEDKTIAIIMETPTKCTLYKEPIYARGSWAAARLT